LFADLYNAGAPRRRLCGRSRFAQKAKFLLHCARRLCLLHGEHAEHRTIEAAPLKPAPPQSIAPVPGQTLLTARITSDGLGGYRVTPEKPLQEIPSRKVAEMLTMSRGNLALVVNSPLGQKHLRWRWLTPKRGKRVFELDSVIAYREALKKLD
jgi:hypothetical protein